MTCCVRGCESPNTHEHHVNGAKGAFGRQMKYIVRICEACKSLLDQPIRLNYFQCGGLAFVNEIWKEDETDGTC